MIIMSRCTKKSVSYAPFYIHSFHLIQPHKLTDAEKFNLHYTDPSQIDNTPDKLRWYRYQHHLLQKEVAAYLEIDRTTYCSFEEGQRDYYPIQHIQKLATLYSIPAVELLDEYNLFLYYGQGDQIRYMRQSRNMSQAKYAEHLGVCRQNLRQWEKDQVRITKQTWELLMNKG